MPPRRVKRNTEITGNFSLNEGETIVCVSLGSDYSSVVTSEGRVFTWGSNTKGELGDNTTRNKSLPTEITNNFNKNGKLSPFQNTGLLIKGKVYTTKTEPNYDGKRTVLADVLQNGEVTSEFFIDDKDNIYEFQLKSKAEVASDLLNKIISEIDA